MARFALKAVAAVVAVSLAACSDGPVQPGDRTASPDLAVAGRGAEEVVAGEVIVKLKAGADINEVGRKFALARGDRGYAGRFDVLRGVKGQERADAARLAADPSVEYAEPNYLRQTTAIDSRLWAFYNPGGLNMSFYNDPNGRTGPIGASYASILDADEDNIEGYAAGGGDVVIGSIDTGVDFQHPEFTG